MKTATEKAPSKLILLGEHAVVYGQPAIAVPLREPSAEAVVTETSESEPVAVELKDFGLRWTRGEKAEAEEILPFAHIVRSCIEDGGRMPGRGWKLSIRSDIPIGCGLGSGAAVSTAALRAIHRFFGFAIAPRELSALVYETERMLHGTPSGIDNTVIATERPVLFRKGEDGEFIEPPAAPIFFVIGYTGKRHKTFAVVTEVAEARAADPETYDGIFADIGEITRKGAAAFRAGAFAELGRLMDENHRLLERLGVSSPELERMVQAAQAAGALGAKLSGAGRGGCMVALAPDAVVAGKLEEALRRAGSVMTVTTGILRRKAAACG
ncbi:MAG: mevalonate kinase [Elusimicrobiota bacterium]